MFCFFAGSGSLQVLHSIGQVGHLFQCSSLIQGIPAQQLHTFGELSLQISIAGCGVSGLCLALCRGDHSLQSGAVCIACQLNRLVAEDALESEVEKLANSIAENAPLSLKAGKLAINHAAGYGFDGGAQAVKDAAERCFDSADYREGRSAFLEKRKAQFKGE